MAAKVLVRRVRVGDVASIAQSMRQADRDEAALIGFSPGDGLQLSVDASKEVWTVDVDGVPCAMFGLGRGTNDTAAPWLLATDGFALAWVGVSRRARRMVRCWSRLSALENWCDGRNAVALRFLEWLGFTMDPIDGRTMVRFSMPKAVR